MTESARRAPGDTTFAAAIVLGLEGSPTAADRTVVVRRLERAIRPWDTVVDVDAASVSLLCTTLTNAREVDALAARLAAVARAPIAVGDEVRTFGVCVGAATVGPGEEPAAALARAGAAMREMRAARSGLLAPAVTADVPAPRRAGVLALPG